MLRIKFSAGRQFCASKSPTSCSCGTLANIKKSILKYVYLILVIAFYSCNSDKPITETEQKEFEKVAQTWHNRYVQGSENLEEILLGLDENIIMWENGKVWTYKEVEKFGPHLPKKNIIETYNDQKLLKKDFEKMASSPIINFCGYSFATSIN